MIVKPENYYPSLESERGSRTKFWECERVNFRIYHFDSEYEFAKAVKARKGDLEVFSRPLPGDETPFNAVEAEFHPYRGNSQRCLIRGAIIYIMNDAGKTIEVIRTDSRRLSKPQNESRQVKYRGKKRKVVGADSHAEDKGPSKDQRGKVPIAGHQKAGQKGPYAVAHDDLGECLPDDPLSILDRAYYTAAVVGSAVEDGEEQRGMGPVRLRESGQTGKCINVYPGQYLSILGGVSHRHVDWKRIRSWEKEKIVLPVKLASTCTVGPPKPSQVEDWMLPKVVVHDHEDSKLVPGERPSFTIIEKSDFTAQYDPAPYDPARRDVALLLSNGPNKVLDRIVVNPGQYISVINGTLEGHLEFERITRLVRDGTLKVIKDRHGSLHGVIENSGE